MEVESDKPHLKPLWKFDRTDAREELNLAEFPLAAIASRLPEGQKTLVFEDQIYDQGNGERVARKLTISGSDQYGLPTAIDNDVLLALMHLTKCRNGFTERTVNFSRYELVRFLQWDDGGKSYRRLEQSLNVLASVTLFYNRAWWDRGGKAWRNRTFHILESVELRGRDRCGESEQPTSSITWNGVIFASFTANYIKKLNLEVYFQLENKAARRAYRFLDKRFYHKRRLEFDLRTFAYEHLGFSRTYDTGQLKRKLEPALKELEGIGFLKPVSRDERFTKRGPGNWTITLERSHKGESAKPSLLAPNDVARDLVERGVSPAIAAEISQSFSEEDITRQVAAFDSLMKGGGQKIKNPPGFLVKSIRDSYSLQNKVKSEAPTIATSKGLRESPPVLDAQQAARNAFWKTLPEDEQNRVEREAFEQADAFILAGWKRSLESGSESATKGYRQAILDRHLDRLLDGEKSLRKAS